MLSQIGTRLRQEPHQALYTTNCWWSRLSALQGHFTSSGFLSAMVLYVSDADLLFRISKQTIFLLILTVSARYLILESQSVNTVSIPLWYITFHMLTLIKITSMAPTRRPPRCRVPCFGWLLRFLLPLKDMVVRWISGAWAVWFWKCVPASAPGIQNPS